MGSFLTVLKNRDFRYLWLAQITSQIALNMLIFVLGIEVYRHTHSNTSVSLILLSFGLPSIFFGIPAGSIVDFYDKRTILIICNVSRAVLLLLFFLFSKQILALYLLSIVMSIITQFFVPAEAPSIASLIKSRDQLLPANSIFTISFYFSTIFGFIISGPAVRFLGPSFVYGLMTLLMILASVFVAKLPMIKTPAKEKVKSLTVATIIDSMLEGLRFIRSHPRVGQSLMLLTFAQALISVLVVLAPGFADKIVRIPLEDASFLVMGPAAIGLVGGAFWVGKYGHSWLKGHIIRFGIMASALSLLSLSIVARFRHELVLPPIFIFFWILLGIGFFNSLVNVPSSTILQQDSESEVRGRVYGILTSLTGGVSVLPVVLSGILADLTSVTETVFAIGIVTLMFGLYEIIRTKSTK